MRGWGDAMDCQSVQLRLINKLFEKNGLQIKMTCPACPEQYEVFKDGNQVAYFRLRHGVFSVDYPTCNGETIYETEPNGDGIFDDNERLNYMLKAMRAVILRLDKKYPICGYAPGNYACICVTCKEQFIGDKRAVQCEKCAIKNRLDG